MRLQHTKQHMNMCTLTVTMGKQGDEAMCARDRNDTRCASYTRCAHNDAHCTGSNPT